VPKFVEKALPSAYRDEERREHAAFLISQIGPAAEAAIPALIRILEDQTEDGDLEREVLQALKAMGESGAITLPKYIAYLRSDDDYTQVVGADLLSSIGPRAKIAVPALLEAADGTNSRLRWAAAKALWSIDRQTNVAVRVFTTGLQSTNHTTRQLALIDLRQMGTAAKAAGPMVQAALQDPDDLVRREAEKTLRELDPGLLLSSLQKLNEQAAAIVERLVRTIQTGEFKDRFRALETIAVFGPDAKPAVPALIEVLNGPGPQLPGPVAGIGLMNSRREAACALAEIGPEARAGVPALIALIREHRDQYRYVYCKALGRIGSDAKEAVPVLEDALRDENRGVRLAAAEALTRIVPQGTSNAVAVLKGLQHDPELAKVWVMDNSGMVRATPQQDFQNPSSRFFRLCASVPLWRLGLEKESPVASLIEELGRNNVSDLPSLIELLGEIGPEAKAALPVLTKLLSPDNSVRTRRAAAIAIRKIDPAEAARLGLPGMLVLP
jgi:HEAT repeat protein